MQLKTDEEVEKLLEQFVKLKQEAKVLEEFFKVQIANPPKFSFEGLVKAYAEAVKDTDGLTTMRPATVKAVQTAEKDVTDEHITAAIKELEAHVKDVTKAHSSNKSAKKGVDNFTTEIHHIVETLNKHLK